MIGVKNLKSESSCRAPFKIKSFLRVKQEEVKERSHPFHKAMTEKGLLNILPCEGKNVCVALTELSVALSFA
jgi:hypothetical protein